MKIKYLFNILLSFLLLYSCGKQVEGTRAKNGAQRNRSESRTPVDLDQFILKQKLVCEDVLFCPDNVAKIIVAQGTNIHTCTGTLVGKRKLITSASCLPSSLRIPNLDCRKNIFAIFPEDAYGGEFKTGCQRVMYVDNNSIQEAPLWKSGIAILELDRDVPRKISGITSQGAQDNEKLETWKVKYDSDFVSVLTRDECQFIHNTYLNPFSQGVYSPMMVATSCDYDELGMGAPIMKGNNIVAIYSQEMSHRTYSYLQNGKLVSGDIDRYYHMTNTSCSPGVRQLITFKKHNPNCSLWTTIQELDQRRSNLFKGKAVHLSSMEKLKKELGNNNKYFAWNFDFAPDETLLKYDVRMVRPSCIYRSNDWIGEYRRWRSIRTYAWVSIPVPHYQFSIKLDSFLRPISILDNIGTKYFQVEFNPFNAYVNKDTFVTIKSNLFGKLDVLNFNHITGDCL